MKKIIMILLLISVATGFAGCAEVSKVMKSDASLSEKFKQFSSIVGNYFDRQSGTRAEAVKKHNYLGRGDLLEIDSASLTPDDVTPGDKMESVVQYTALAAREDQQIRITETRTLQGDKESFQLNSREVVRTQGSHVSTMKFTLPKDMAKGNYTLVTTISDGKNSRTVKNPLRVV
ncbi:MAG: hypothetical protein Q7V00_05160 [Sulfurimicrobium sp.]|nr:hypothetical protein [Sulfurimicrobium sp.]MDP1703905.1 hypothetical protein [Sulfurimicrobium sp.]MDP2198454.1 hypothetical protein [Sulfurimicrobium sp.]MDP3689251.1 hypothetical protein [Sulfurimicrobium sp.]